MSFSRLVGTNPAVAGNTDRLDLGTAAIAGESGRAYLVLVAVAKQPGQAISFVRFWSPAPGLGVEMSLVDEVGDLSVWACQTPEQTGYSNAHAYVQFDRAGKCAGCAAVVNHEPAAAAFALESTAQAEFSKSANASSGPATRTAPCFLWGIVATAGPVGDAPGSWTALTNGNRAGTSGNPAAGNRTIHEGFLSAESAGSSEAAISGMTARAGSIALACYRVA